MGYLQLFLRLRFLKPFRWQQGCSCECLRKYQTTKWLWCYPTPSEGWGVEELHGDPTVGPRPKVWTRGKKWKWCRRWRRAGEARMLDSQGRSESDPAEGVHRRGMKNSPSVLFCIGKRTKEGCDRGSEVETVHNG